MKIFSCVVLIIGLILTFTPTYSILGGVPESGGYFALFVGVPLILIGLVSFYSIIAPIAIFLGIVIYFISQKNSFYTISQIGLIIALLGLVYALSEGLYKITKK